MSPSLHRFIVHGHLCLKMDKDLKIPLGRFSESALEMRNKDRRKARLRFARKNSIENNTADIYHYLLRTSDPLVNMFKISRSMYICSPHHSRIENKKPDQVSRYYISILHQYFGTSQRKISLKTPQCGAAAAAPHQTVAQKTTIGRSSSSFYFHVS